MDLEYIKIGQTNVPDERGYYGEFGGRYVPETLMPALDELTVAYQEAMADPAFPARLAELQRNYTGRPTPVTYAGRLTEHLGGARIYLKREDLAHTGAHKINNALGQALLAQRMGKKRIVAETGAGQHGVASATVSALLGLECHVYMGKCGYRAPAAQCLPHEITGRGSDPGGKRQQNAQGCHQRSHPRLGDKCRNTFYLLGSALGPHPYPMMVRDFQSVIGTEARQQMFEQAGRLPDVCIACVGGGSNAIGLFHGFRDDENVDLIGVEAGGHGVASGEHAARFADPSKGRPGVLHGTRSFVLQDDDGQIMNTHSVSAGLDYASVGPEHAYLRQNERAFYTLATDDEALEAFQTLCQLEGIIPALESSHAVAEAIKRAPTMPKTR